MASLRSFLRIGAALPSRTLTGLRSLSAEQRSYDKMINIKNPYLKPEFGCVLCKVTVDYRNIQLLSQFVSPLTGRIYGRRITNLCAKKQKEVSKAIKKAHSMGFMSVTHKHPEFMKDPTPWELTNEMKILH